MGRLPRDDARSQVSIDNELKVIDMIKKISQQQLEEMFGPFFMGLNQPPADGPRVTSDIKVAKPQPQKVNKPPISQINEQVLREQLHYMRQIKENPLYVNQSVAEPWKLFARIADKLFDEMLDEVISELDFDEKSFVENFIKAELQY